MSRSRRHSPVLGITTATSDKPWKRQNHSRRRAAERIAMAADALETLPTATRLHAEGYGPKDGKHRLSDPGRDNGRWLRK